MNRIALLVGSSKYDHEIDLPCCSDDLSAVQRLLIATARYDSVIKHENLSSGNLKTAIRADLSDNSYAEIFFYFSGHGAQIGNDFFFCATDFSQKRPNETGLSNVELHDFFRSCNPDLVIKLVDACNSGTVLIKSDASFLPTEKSGLKNIIQIASCLDTQNSLTGNPLSQFTESFCRAALHKVDGRIYYSDLISVLRDEYLSNDRQTPFFVSQGTGRELFIEDASILSGFRSEFNSLFISPHLQSEDSALFDRGDSLSAALLAADKQASSAAEANQFIADFFKKLKSDIEAQKLSNVFEYQMEESADFNVIVGKSFIGRIISRERRPDKFVTARNRKEADQSPFGRTFLSIAAALQDDNDADWDIRLNCDVTACQIKVTLTPKFKSLRKLILIVSCAPSLYECFIFEIVTEHMLVDWGSYDSRGEIIANRWYRQGWKKGYSNISAKIAESLSELVAEQITAAENNVKN